MATCGGNLLGWRIWLAIAIAMGLSPMDRCRGAGPFIYVMNIDGTGLRRLVETPQFSGQGSPSWSHDGRRIAIDAWGADGDSKAHIVVVSADGTEVRDLGHGAMPSWSPDDQVIAFQRYDQFGMWAMNSQDGSERVQLLPRAISAQWSPDGARIAAMKLGNGTAVVAYNAVTMEEQQLTPFDEHEFSLGMGWAPDGKRICCRKVLAEGGQSLVLIDFDPAAPAGGARISTRLKGLMASQMKWSPDGKRILICLKRDDHPKVQLYLVDPDANGPPQLVPGQDPNVHNVDPCWSPDGKQIAFAANSDNYDL